MSPSATTGCPASTRCFWGPTDSRPAEPVGVPVQARWTLLEVCTWPAATQASPPVSPPVTPGPGFPRHPRRPRWPDVDDLGPVEWLPISARSQHAS